MDWAHDLHKEFSLFFLRWFEEHGMQIELVEEPESNHAMQRTADCHYA
jgi:hypothetical protein